MSEHEFESLTDLGRRYGVSSHEMGRWLAKLGLRRVGGLPTDKARELGLVKQIPTGRGEGFFFVWNVVKTMRVLKKESGHEPLAEPIQQNARIEGVSEFDAPCKPLTGPFDRIGSGDGWQIVNGNGAVILWTMDEDVAKKVTRVLQLAYDHRATFLDWDES
jgi:hypothetical protein